MLTHGRLVDGGHAKRKFDAQRQPFRRPDAVGFVVKAALTMLCVAPAGVLDHHVRYLAQISRGITPPWPPWRAPVSAGFWRPVAVSAIVLGSIDLTHVFAPKWATDRNADSAFVAMFYTIRAAFPSTAPSASAISSRSSAGVRCSCSHSALARREHPFTGSPT
jgi:hypothetical protein